MIASYPQAKYPIVSHQIPQSPQAPQIPQESSAPQIVPITPNSLALSVRDFSFTLRAMSGDDAQNWMTSRLMCHWRQIHIARNISNTILQSTITPLEKITADVKDEYLNTLTAEYLQLMNILVARALDSNDGNLVRSLSEHEKIKILVAQDSLNGLDLLAEIVRIEKVDKAAKDLRAKEFEAKEANYIKLSKLSKPSKLSKKLKKSLETKAPKSSKKKK